MKTAPLSLGPHLQAFFTEHLTHHKRVSRQTLASMRDSFRLLLEFLRLRSGIEPAALQLTDIDAKAILAFLDHLEQHRGNSIRSRNVRLSAIRTFFRYVAVRDPDRLGQVTQVMAIPVKRQEKKIIRALTREQMDAILAVPDRMQWSGRRDHALLLTMYNSGARVSEMTSLQRNQVHFGASTFLELHGKGDKWRSCPIWEETAVLLQRLFVEQQSMPAANRLVFTGPNGAALTRFGIYKIVRRHTGQLDKIGADGKPRHVSPHAWRHSTAVHLLESGVEVNVIRAWLGHASLETTNRYAEITIRTKQAALDKCAPPATGDHRMPRKAPWQTDSDLLKWLQSL